MVACDCSLVSLAGFQDLTSTWVAAASSKRPKLRSASTLTAKQTSVTKYKYGVPMRPQKRSRKTRSHEHVKRRVAALMASGRAVSENCPA